MAGVSETRTLNSLLTTTLAHYRKTLIDNIFDDYVLLSWINGKLGKAMRGDSLKKMLDGGESIYEHILYEQSTAVKSYAGAETLDTTIQDGMTMARYNWKQYAATVSITGLEKRSNQGEARMINLLQGKTDQAIMTLKDLMNRHAFGTNAAATKNLIGLQDLVSTTVTLGNINPSTYTWWKGDVTTSAGSFAAGGLDKMRTSFNNVSYGNDKPDFIVTDQTTFEYFEGALQPQERYTNTKAANSGFMNLTFKGVPVFFDRDCTSGYMYFLNSRYVNFFVHSDADFTTGKFVEPEDQDVTSAKILFQGNLTTNNRRMNAVIQGFTA